MSLYWMESFAGMPRFAELPANLQQHNVVADALTAAGYRVERGSNGPFLTVTNDPIVPERTVLAASVSGTTAQYYNAAVARELPFTRDPIVIGFSLFIPQGFTPGTQQSGSLFAVHASYRTSPLTTVTDLLNIDHSLSISSGGQYQSAFKPKTGVLNYFEIRLDPYNSKELRAWMNDALVAQRPLSGTFGAFIFRFFVYQSWSANGWCLGNLYVLVEDGIAPTVRLGPTTRVIGRRPSQDINVAFVRPSDASSNSEVVAQDLKSIPDRSLQSEQAGSSDIYGVPTSGAINSAPLVHAVGVKVYGANLDAVDHSISPLLVSGEAEADDDGPTVVEVLPKFTDADLTMVMESPSGGIIVGGPSGIWYSTAEQDGGSWTQLTHDVNNSEISYGALCGTFSDNGNGVIVLSNGDLLLCPAGSQIWQWVKGQTLGLGTGAQAIAANGDVFISVGSVSPYMRRFVYPVGGDPQSFTNPAGTFGAQSDVRYGNGVWIATRASGYVIRSVDNGVSWANVSINNNINLPIFLAYGNGTWLLCPERGSAYDYVLRSVDDGQTWIKVSGILQSGIYNSELTFIDGKFFALGRATTQGMAGPYYQETDNGVNWTATHSQFTSNTSQNLTGMIKTRTGRVIIIGQQGLIAVAKKMVKEKKMPSMSGYRMMHLVSNKDPLTGEAWQGGAASNVKIGMRVES